MVLTINTSTPDTHLGFFSDDGEKLGTHKWHADRSLARDLLAVLLEQLTKHEAELSDIKGIVCFRGPGSFTGLRIGAAVVNTIAFENHVPIVGTLGENWVAEGLKRLQNNEDDKLVLPEYGREARITKQKK